MQEDIDQLSIKESLIPHQCIISHTFLDVLGLSGVEDVVARGTRLVKRLAIEARKLSSLCLRVSPRRPQVGCILSFRPCSRDDGEKYTSESVVVRNIEESLLGSRSAKVAQSIGERDVTNWMEATQSDLSVIHPLLVGHSSVTVALSLSTSWISYSD